ncbi:helix-turn-helix domain-containing protein [Paracoccus laeviglucosivorans]|uniref:Transcriptional regulator, contains XRE-family HTH domain n=1 Tax=Paracoccus laeviglucosivorans TaxID=1197861 RepID=A0A521E5H1_9RHOB|nr:helix-turn-helix transcriptional regulator [Paracoccus laeviglucosivorans]SMO79196.1 Transcriptional regulator, contains XRE-family HTH domain [Paracoccus laeviglucosivorans]
MNLQRIRRARGLNQAELAEMAKVEQSMISKIENGFDGVTLRVLRKLAAALDVEVIDLLSDDRTVAERALVQSFRGLSPERQQGWLDMARMIAEPPPPKP